ncbi:MAG: LptF/LptG family permease [Sphingobacteriales bacterium]|nr:LptF/LptG family permease [Sphingobacteriales bacterium]
MIFILLMQFIWLYIDDLAGKGIGWLVISKLMFFFSASIIPLALPLSILLSSIMTFGNLGETYELIAAKAAGVSIWRIFKPMFMVVFMLALFGFFVSNVLIPQATLKYRALLYDIKQQKPALFIRDGVFYNGIEGISMRVGRKEPNSGKLLDIIIYDNRGGVQNPVIVTAQSGTMHMSEDGRYMFFNLFNGWRYEEMERQSNYYRNYPHLGVSFSEEEVVFDMYAFNLNRTDESLFKDGYQMLNVLELQGKIDSLTNLLGTKYKYTYTYADMYYRINDSLYKEVKPAKIAIPVAHLADSFSADKANAITLALSNARSMKSIIDYVSNDTRETKKMIIRYKIEWHKKFTLSVACIIMFFIGAPFGSIIRKGGFGMPVVISVLLYLVFHIVSLTGDKMAKTQSASPALGMWLSIMVLFPVGLFLTYQAANDSGLFDKSAWVNLVRSFKRRA